MAEKGPREFFDNIKRKEWLTSDEAAYFLGIARKTLYNLVSQGKLHPKKPFGKLLFCKDELNSLIENSR